MYISHKPKGIFLSTSLLSAIFDYGNMYQKRWTFFLSFSFLFKRPFFFFFFICIWSMNALIMAFQNEWPTRDKSLTSSAHVFCVLLVLMHSTFRLAFRAGSAHQKHIYYEYKYVPLSVFSSYYYLYACIGKSEMTSLFNTDI